MEKHEPETPPVRGANHEALSVFLGDWTATGTSFGDASQSKTAPRSNETPWSSTHNARWHSGAFFLIQDERAHVGSAPFDTLSIMGVDPTTGAIFARTFENHGFFRRYEASVMGRVWTLSGERERARIELSEDGNRQTIHWEWRPEDGWLPLCDRVAIRK